MSQQQVGFTGLVGVCLCLGVACDATPDIELRAGEEAYRCPTWQCGYNSAEVHGSRVRELNLDGAPNSDGVRLIGFVPPKGPKADYVLDVVGDELVASSKDAGELRGHSLVGARLTLLVDGLTLDLRIDDARAESSWAAQGDTVMTYKLSVQQLLPPHDFVSVCAAGEKSEDTAYAVVLGGERYDPHSITVQTSPRWFSLGCGTTALAKAALMGYGPQTDFPGEDAPASPERRQATLKMLTADYCGIGHPYTEDAVFLLYANHAGTIAPLASVKPGPLEAIWTKDGALCLEHTRMPTKVGLCDLPSCDGLDLGDGEWITRLP